MSENCSIAAQAVCKAVDDVHYLNVPPSSMVIATAGIEAAASQLLPARNNAERLLRQAFLALVKELRGQPLPDASRDVLAEQFPALQPAPQQATAEPTPAPRVDKVVDKVAELAAQLSRDGRHLLEVAHAQGSRETWDLAQRVVCASALLQGLPQTIDGWKSLAAARGIHWPDSPTRGSMPECVFRALLEDPEVGPLLKGETATVALTPAPQREDAPTTPPAQELPTGLMDWLDDVISMARELEWDGDVANLTRIKDILLRHHTSEPVAWCRSDEFANAMKRGGSFNGWKDPGQGASRCDMPLYASPPPRSQSIAPTTPPHCKP